MTNNKNMKKILIVGLLLLSFLAYSCAPPPDFPDKNTLLINYESEDNNLARPTNYETNPSRGRHVYDEETNVFLSDTSIYYEVAKWSLYNLDDMTFIRDFEQSPVPLKMNQNYLVEVSLQCLTNEACRRGVCQDNMCVENESTTYQVTGEYREGDEEVLGSNLAVINEIGTEAILVTMNDVRKAVLLGQTTLFDQDMRVRLNNIITTWDEGECADNISNMASLDLTYPTSINYQLREGDTFTALGEEFYLVEVGPGVIQINTNTSMEMINLTGTAYFKPPGVDITFNSITRQYVVDLTVEYTESKRVIMKEKEIHMFDNEKVISLREVQPNATRVTINNEEKWIGLNNEVTFEETNTDVYLDRVFYQDPCPPIIVDKKASVTFTYRE